MKRRTAIQQLGIFSIGILSVPACTSESSVAVDTGFLDKNAYAFLEQLVNTVLPPPSIVIKTPEPTPTYIIKIIEHTSPPHQIDQFQEGLYAIKIALKKASNTSNITSEDIEQLYVKNQKEIAKNSNNLLSTQILHVLDTVKSLAIEHLITSEYFQTNHLDYQFIPTPFEACTNI